MNKIRCGFILLMGLIFCCPITPILANGVDHYGQVYQDNVTQIDRYATVENRASAAQINPLLAIAQFRFQPSVQTIGDAIHQVLQNTSYQLVPENQLPEIAKETLTKPLPITVRSLGPISIKDAVLVLMGKEVFNLIVDPAHRLINFRVKPGLIHVLGANHEYHSKG